MDELSRFKQVIAKLKWKISYNAMPAEDINEKNRNCFTENLFETISPQNIRIHVGWSPPRDLKGKFHFTVSKEDDLDTYHMEDTRLQRDSALNHLSNLIDYFSNPDWRWYLETVAERKYTIVGDKVFYRDEKEAKVLVCIDKASRKEIFRKNLVNAKIARIEKHPENKGLFILFDSKEFKQADYERMKRTNFGLFDLNGNLIWWAEPLITPLVGGEIGRNHIFFKQGAWLPLNAPADKKYDPAVYSMKYSAWCRFDADTGKLKEFGEHR